MISPARALERARSLFSLGQVRARFGRVAAPDPRAATMLLRDLALRLEDLGPAERAAAERILARPTGPGSDPDKYSTEETPFCSTHVCVHYVGSTLDEPPFEDVSGVIGVPDYVETASAVLEEVWALEVDGLNYKAPKSDLTSPNHGPDGKLDIYLANIGDDGIFGYCTSDDPHLTHPYSFWDMSAYCVLDNDYDPLQFHMPLDALQVTAAHEFFHAVQFHYDIGEDIWFMEGTATWIEDEAYDDVNDSLRYLQAVRWGSRRPARPQHRVPDLRDVDLLALPGRVLRRGDPGERDRSRDVEPCRRVAGRPRPLLDPGGRAGDRREDRERHAVEAPVGLRRLRRLEQPAGEVLRRGRVVSPAPVAQNRTLTRATPSFRLEHDARPPHEPFGRDPSRFEPIGHRQAQDRRGRSWVRHGTGGEPPRDPEDGVSSVRSVILNSNGNGAVTVAFGSSIARVLVILTNGSSRYGQLLLGTDGVRVLRGRAARPEPAVFVPRDRRLSATRRRRSPGTGARSGRRRATALARRSDPCSTRRRRSRPSRP